jgi:hypothetical protein
VESDIRDNPAMSRFEMPLGDGALACRKSCPARGTDRGWRMAFSKRCDATVKE